MKRLALFAVFLICNVLYAQPADTILTFKLRHPPAGENDIDWSRERPECVFELKGSEPLTYRFQLINDDIAQLDRFEDEKWLVQEDMGYTSYFLFRENDTLISPYRITDFDQDGDEDLYCWLYSNMNGNVWTIIFLNDQKAKKLVRLINTADDTDIWDWPEYDPVSGIINCTLHGSAPGVSAESTYRLDGLKAVPVEKHYQDRSSGRYFEDFYYVGNNGKWELKKKTKTRG